MKRHGAVENLKGMLAECGHWLSQSPYSRAKKEAELKRLYANCAKSAARHGRERSLKMCLETQLVNANLCTSKGNSLLHLAAYNGSVGACQVLLTRGAKAEKRNRHGESTWETARMKGHDKCANAIVVWQQQQDGQSRLEAADEFSLSVDRLEKEQEHQKMLEFSPPEPRKWTPGKAPSWIETDQLLRNVIDDTVAVAKIHATRKGDLTADDRQQVDALCENAHENYAKAYLLERAMLVESLKGVKDIPTPKSYKEAVASEFADYWNQAIVTEIQNLESHDVWEFVYKKDLPKGTRLVDSKWAFRVKRW